MNNNLQRAKELLITEGYTLVLNNGTDVLSSRERGVKPLLNLIDSGSDFSSFSAADKVVGAAAAYLYVLLNVKEIYVSVLSEKAEKVFIEYGIMYYADKKVPYIINRNGDGVCPMESAVRGAASAEDALLKIKGQIEKLTAH